MAPTVAKDEEQKAPEGRPCTGSAAMTYRMKCSHESQFMEIPSTRACAVQTKLPLQTATDKLKLKKKARFSIAGF